MKTHRSALISVSELIDQKQMQAKPKQEEINWALNQLIDPEMNITLLAEKLQRLKLALGLPLSLMLHQPLLIQAM